MKIQNFLFSLLLLVIMNPLLAQIEVIPPLPTADEPVVVRLNTAGTNFTGDIYAHTGITIGEVQWQYVIGDWEDSSTQPKLEQLNDTIYELEISPSIREFYGAGAGDEITQMCFVFKNEDGSLQTSPDIFYDVFKLELSLIITQPLIHPVIAELDDIIEFAWSTKLADSTFLFLNEQLLFADTGSSFDYQLQITETGTQELLFVAKNEDEMVSESLNIYVRGEIVVEELPQGVRDGINYLDDETVVLVLYAPGKEFVYAWGDYNDWAPTEEVYMKQTPDGQRFWLQIDGLTPGQPYVFQYLIDGDIKVGDMYATQVSDPWNDQYIPSSIFPNIPEYPGLPAEGIASVIKTGQQEYNWNITNFESPKTTDLVIYEMLVRDFLEKHDFSTILDTLDYLERLGINVLELMPFNEFEGNSSWGYNPNYYFAVDKYYGPPETLKALIDECHARGIAVVMDIVLNHAYYTCPFVQMYWNWPSIRPAADNPWFNEVSNFENPGAQWGYDFDHESPATQAFVDSVNSFWMSEYQIDGFRFDFTKGFGNNIKDANTDPWGSKYDADRIALLKRMADEIWARNPDALVIFEHLSDNSEETELAEYGILLWGNANYNYNEATMGWNENGKSDFSWISYQERGWSQPHVVGYMESHDEERLMFKNITYGNSNAANYKIKDTTIGLQRMALAANFFYTIPGPKMIWQFGERGYDVSIDAFGGRLAEKPPRWEYMDDWRRRFLYDVNRTLIQLKKEKDVFETTDFTLDVRPALKKINLQDENTSVVILGNFDNEAGTIIAGFQHPGIWYEYWSGDTLEVGDAEVGFPIELQAGEYRLYTDEYWGSPDFVGIDEPDADFNASSVRVYPNPSSGLLFIDWRMKKAAQVEFQLYDLNGRLVQYAETAQGIAGMNTKQISLKSLNPGMYVLVMKTEQQITTHKILAY